MAPGIYKTFRKSLKDSLYKFSEFFDHESTADRAVHLEVSSHILDILDKTNEELDEYLVPKADVYKVSDDYLVEKYVSKIIKLSLEDTRKQTYQAMEGFVHNLNTLHSRAGAQVSNVA